MNMDRTVRWLAGALALALLAAHASPLARADTKSQTAREIAEYVMERFGRQAVREGAPALARKIEAAAARHGTEVFEAVRKVGPRALLSQGLDFR